MLSCIRHSVCHALCSNGNGGCGDCSALTTTIVGVIKSAVTSALGFFFLWGDAPVDPLNVAGITLNFLGGSYYTYVK